MQKRCDNSYNFIFNAYVGDMQVIELNPSSYLGYQLKHAVLHGACRHDEAIEVFKHNPCFQNKHRVQGAFVIDIGARRYPNGAHPRRSGDVLPLCHAIA
jgi:hypothetical protein